MTYQDLPIGKAFFFGHNRINVSFRPFTAAPLRWLKTADGHLAILNGHACVMSFAKYLDDMLFPLSDVYHFLNSRDNISFLNCFTQDELSCLAWQHSVVEAPQLRTVLNYSCLFNLPFAYQVGTPHKKGTFGISMQGNVGWLADVDTRNCYHCAKGISSCTFTDVRAVTPVISVGPDTPVDMQDGFYFISGQQPDFTGDLSAFLHF